MRQAVNSFVVAAIVFWLSSPARGQSHAIFYEQPLYVAGDTIRFSLHELTCCALREGHAIRVSLVDSAGNIGASAWSRSGERHFEGEIVMPSSATSPYNTLVFQTLDAGNWIILKAGVPVRFQGQVSLPAALTADEATEVITVECPEDVPTRTRVPLTLKFDPSISRISTMTIRSTELFGDIKDHLFPVQRHTYQQKEFAAMDPRNMTITGRVLDQSAKTLCDSCRVTFYFGRSIMSYPITTDASGFFRFNYPELFTGGENVFYQVTDKRGQFFHATVAGDTVTGLPAKISSADRIAAYAGYAEKRGMIQQAYRKHISPMQLRRLEIDSLHLRLADELDGFDLSRDLDDYVSFPGMAELVREILPMVSLRTKGSLDVVRIYFRERQRTADEDPLYLIDDVYTRDTKFFIGLNPSDIRSVNVVYSRDKLARLGSFADHGLIVVRTRSALFGESSPQVLPFFSYTGWSPVKPLNRRTNLQASPRIPDFRSALYWDPAIVPVREVKKSFRTSDDVGAFQIVIFVIGNDDRPSVLTKRFVVTRKAQP